MFKPSSLNQVIVLWKLALSDGPYPIQAMKPVLNASTHRRDLVDANLVEITQTGRKKYYQANEEKIWHWISHNLDIEKLGLKNTNSKFSGEVLFKILARLEHYLEHENLFLAQLLTSQEQTSQDQTSQDQTSEKWSSEISSSKKLVAEKMEQLHNQSTQSDSSTIEENNSHEKLTESEVLETSLIASCIDLQETPSGRVRLHHLRQKLNKFQKDEVDKTLLDLQTHGRIVMYPIQVKSEITPEDVQASLQVGVAAPVHLVSMRSL